MNKNELNRFAVREWEKEQEPFQMAPHVYYVGTKYVGSYLIDTGDGLILIDQGFAETVYLIFESIRKLNYTPYDIKYLFVSHGHFDHCGGTRLIREYTKAKVFMSEQDFKIKKEHPEWVSLGSENWIDFDADHFYDEKKPVTLGDMSITTLLTPGHTPGTTSFVFTDRDASGKEYLCAMHGGVGLNTLMPEFYAEYPGWPTDLIRKFIDSMDKMLKIKADIPLPSHPIQIPVLDKAGTYVEGDKNPFINPKGWTEMLTARKEKALSLMGSGSKN
ncbi:MBL fold metallo-hydrolase [Treponema parvum]|uniref:MBL fold metallo-hydrolase n=1 Tax=Treponema parvum TaxID=138851 RepID=A0A975F049_9SPIR|nr:MBL fold metallo-hydrolase [Treponema parvum]QTQ12021.1 MBL fold metallo-hydrolase [Treponema parvum]